MLAMPSASSWRLEVLEDSGRILPSHAWARVPKIDPGTGKASTAPVSTPPTTSEKVTGSVRLVSLDLPLTALQSDGSLRVRTKLRVRVTWTGSVRTSDGTSWKNLVDNPGGIQARLPAAGRKLGSALNLAGGRTISIQVGDTAPFSTREDGLVRLTGAQIYQVLGIDGGVSWPNVALYGGTGDTVSVANPDTLPAPGLQLIPYQKVDRNGDGVLDPDDEIWFWVRGTSIWKADTTLPGGWAFSIHPYSEMRRYYLQLDAPLVTRIGAPRQPSNPKSYTTVWQPVWAGSPNLLLDGLYYESTTDPNTGTGWYWRDAQTASSLGSDQLAYPSTSTLPGLTNDSGVATLYTANCTLSYGDPSGIDFQVGSASGRLLSHGAHFSTYSVKGLSSSGNSFSLANTTGFLVSGYTLTYHRDVSNLDSAVFPAPAMGAISVHVGSGAGTCWVLEHGIAVRTCTVAGGVLTDSATDPDTWYAVFGSNAGSRSAVLSPISAPTQSHAIKDPTVPGTYDLVVVAPDEFMDIAEEYATWRGDAKQIRPMKVGILRAQDVWDLWGSGAMDPAALRNALRWANAKWGISHALLLGSGHADPRGIHHPADATLLPQWEDDEVSTDDFFTWFDSTGVHIPRIAMGRVPARNTTEARAWLDKVELFEDPSKANFGTWRNTIVLAADDQWQAGKPDNLGHSQQTEQIAEAMEVQHPWLHTERLFEQTYPFDNTGFMKPDARRALVDLLNQGTTAFNYMGHGAPYQLTDEDLMDLPTIQRSVVNSTRPFFFFAGSCTVGRHDVPDSRGMSETFVVSAGKGTFAGVAGTRPTFSSENTVLATTLWQRVLDTTGTSPTLGEALQSAKLASAYQSNAYTIQDLYNLLGDPALVLFPGALKVSLDSVPDSLSALSKITLSGTASGAQSVNIRLDHPLPADTFSDATPKEVTVPTPQQLLGVSMLTSGGKYSTSVLLPAKIPFGDSARFKAYAWDPTTRRDGGAVAPSRIMAGVGKEIPSDNMGPNLRIRSCDSSWTGGVTFGKTAKIPLPFCLQVDLQDSSGISSDLGPDEGVVFSLPGVKDPWHPDLQQGVDYRTAFAELNLDSTLMQPGNTYTFQVSARDLMGNISKASLQIQPMAHGQYALYDVFNSPNPVRDAGGTTFYFKLSSELDDSNSLAADTRIQSSVRIHTVSGKLVKVLRTELSQPGKSYPRAVWDLKDSFGRPVANGIYPYTVTLRIPDPTGTLTTDLVKRGIVAVAR